MNRRTFFAACASLAVLPQADSFHWAGLEAQGEYVKAYRFRIPRRRVPEFVRCYPPQMFNDMKVSDLKCIGGHINPSRRIVAYSDP